MANISAPKQSTIRNHQLLGNVIRYQVDVDECEPDGRPT